MNEITITPLGTVSPYCKEKMNCPGFLINYDNEKILLDCGNGITRLLNFPDDLKKLNVFITHYHNDHFGDIGNIQYASYVYHKLGILDEKINIYLPGNDYGFRKKMIISNKESYTNYIDIKNNTKINIGNFKIFFYDNMSHSIESYMVKIQNNDFKIVYTSDIGTTNIDSVISFCKDADLIICESSLLKTRPTENKNHLTAYEAGMLANNAKANQLLLTHFWPEDNKKIYLSEAKQIFVNTEIAEEGKKIRLKKK